MIPDKFKKNKTICSSKKKLTVHI